MIDMDDGAKDGVRPPHDKEPPPNGVNGAFVKSEPSPDEGADVSNKDNADALSAVNGTQCVKIENSKPPQNFKSSEVPSAPELSRMNDLPDEIQHITAGIIPLSLLLTRLAQISHNQLQELVAELATRPIAPNQANGAADYRSTTAEDTSPDSLEKKRMLLNFIQDLHTKWVKALVITEWSRKAHLVGKLIDLKAHIEKQLYQYTAALWEIANVKRDLVFARLPSPDLKTALSVLSSGEVSWMPELGYIEPPPLTPRDQLQWIDNLNTLLSVRLSLEDFDLIPTQFRDYRISSGRVTFQVKGEFEVDLTIADEDFTKQFWFIDFRFLFSPAPAELSDALRAFLEVKVNEALASDGLSGCYKFLHEFVLTHKITEFARQAVELSRGRWTETLKVERLNRSMAIQYWTTRPNPALKSWIILGVHSGKVPQGSLSAKATSCLSLRWFRDNKEVKDHHISFDVNEIATEALLKTIIARHTAHILSSIHKKLLSYPRYSNRESSLSLELSESEPTLSRLTMRLSHADSLTIRIDSTTGSFCLSPPSRIVLTAERNINLSPKDPVDDGFLIIEKTRCYSASEELVRRGKSMGWISHPSSQPPPVRPEELKPLVGIREAFHTVWLRRQGWRAEWFVLVTMSLAGDRWWLVEVTSGTSTARRIRTFTQVPMTSPQPRLSDAFFDNLTIFVTGIISQVTDLRELHNKRVHYSLRSGFSSALQPQIKLPVVYVRLSELVPSLAAHEGTRRPWALDFVRLIFRGAQILGATRRTAGTSGEGLSKDGSRFNVVVEARLSVTDRSKFKLLKGNVAPDVTFNPRLGQFSLRLRAEAGRSVIDSLAARLQAIARLVDFVDALRYSEGDIVCESATLQQVVFTYGGHDPSDEPNEGDDRVSLDRRRWRVSLDLASGSNINLTLERGDPHLRILDLLNKVANTPRLEILPNILNLTLPAFRAVDTIESAWEQITMDDQGSVEVFHPKVDHLTIRYRLPTTPEQQRQVKLHLVVQMRKGQQWWHLYRDRGTTATTAAQGDSDDEFGQALRPVWQGRGEGWKGLGTSAVAGPHQGVGALLAAVDAAIRALVGTPPPPPATIATSSKGIGENAGTTSPTLSRNGVDPSISAQQRNTQGMMGAPRNQGQGGKGKGGKANVVVID
ncbi:hypothetical protein VTK73DRAFT_1648 [Phialemonium thermophilum]|uniref:Mediator of RNA polymerase II transcription subunit 14 n=1 Tax=Phialemonium thermophilum TaxID=223376 RepID=A0ABR3X9L7_9PEZI